MMKSRGSSGAFRHTAAVALRAMAVLILCALILPSCSTKKNTAASRNWQAFTTRYNVYFNGIEHYREQLAQMESKYEDDYTRLLMMHPAEARNDKKLPQPSGDFKRTIEKMQKAIQLHSIKKKPVRRSGSQKEKEFRNREEFNPFLHNAWLTMGKAQFNNGDFLGAASTFFYISKHFKWLPDVVTEALLWEARCYCALDWNYEAENILQRVKPKMLTTKSLANLDDNVRADFLVRTEKYREALPYLQRAAKAAKGSQKNRLWFLLGQVNSLLGQKQEAYQAFKKAAGGSSTAYRTKFNARIKQSEVYTGQNIKPEVNSLRSMLRYERNKEFQDQIYYAIGNLYLSRKDTTAAMENYRKAVEVSTRSGIDKAFAQLALGNIYFAQGDYVKAQPCYSEAVPQLPDNYPDYRMLKRRSDVLDELAVFAGNVQLQDSLLTLSKMTPEEQMAVCQKLADEVIKREKEDAENARREEFLANNQGNTIQDPNAPSTFQLNTDKSWYFYNATAKNAGKTEFQRRWGSRKLEDDWRRRNKTTFSLEDEDTADDSSLPTDSVASDTPGGDNGKEKEVDKSNDPHYPEYYLKQIPSTPEQIKNSNDIIQEGLYNIGLILKDKLEDFPAARKEFDELLTRYPDNIYRLDTYYNLYLMAVRTDDATDAAHWRAMILQDFPESNYGQAMQDPDYFNNLRRMNQIQEEMYADAYKAYLDDDNKVVHALTAEMEEKYPLSPILPKFVFIDALSYVTERNDSLFRSRLETLLQKWPDTDMTDMAGGMLRGLKEGLKPQGGTSNQRGIIWDTRLTSAENPVAADGQPANFERDPEKPQLLVLAFPRDSVSANELLYEVARFNFSSFVVRDFDLEQMSFGNIGLLIVRGFDNLRQLQHYRDVMAEKGFTLPPQVRPVMINKANFELLLREGRSFEDYFRFEQEAAVEDKEREVIGEDDSTPDDDLPTGDETSPDEEAAPPAEEDPDEEEAPGETPTEESEQTENTENINGQ